MHIHDQNLAITMPADVLIPNDTMPSGGTKVNWKVKYVFFHLSTIINFLFHLWYHSKGPMKTRSMQVHCCWCPGTFSCEVISWHAINSLELKYQWVLKNTKGSVCTVLTKQSTTFTAAHLPNPGNNHWGPVKFQWGLVIFTLVCRKH